MRKWLLAVLACAVITVAGCGEEKKPPPKPTKPPVTKPDEKETKETKEAEAKKPAESEKKDTK